MARVPTDAFETYVSLGPDRSYAAVARQLHVAKRTITRLASKERWQERVAEVERDARERAREKATETLQAVNSRHVKIARAIQAKALQALQAMPLQSAMAAVRAMEIAIKVERLVVAEPDVRGGSEDSEGRKQAARSVAFDLREALKAMSESVPGAPEKHGPDESPEV